MLGDGLTAAQMTASATQQTTTTTIERATTPGEPKVGNIADFMRLNPRVFTGNEDPLEAEQWLIDMTNLLEAVNIPAGDQVRVVKVQLADITRT